MSVTNGAFGSEELGGVGAPSPEGSSAAPREGRRASDDRWGPRDHDHPPEEGPPAV